MTDLQDYLTNQYPSDTRDIDEVEQILVSVAEVYRLEFDPSAAWPYEIRASKDVGSRADARTWKAPSQSTTAMILNALLRFGGHFDTVDTSPGGIKRNVFAIASGDEGLPAQNGTQNNSLQAVVMGAGAILSSAVRPSGTASTFSTTYGENDIFTLAWVAEVASANWKGIYRYEKAATAPAEWETIAKQVASTVLNKARGWLRNPNMFTELLNPGDERDATGSQAKVQPHAFTVLRLVQALQRLSAHLVANQVQDCFTGCYQYFERLLHQQLSFSSIPDSRFDPAELMFCLEGMLICRENTVDRTVFDRVISVLSEVQKQSPYWRPVKPFLTTSKGYALFPVSVEIANSLMRACALLDGDSLQDTYGSRCVGLLRRYWQWLRARALRLQRAGGVRIGWHSEHVNDPEVIHLWETSQVMEFLLSFRNALHRHVARTTLVLSRFTEKTPKVSSWDAVTESHEAVNPDNGIGKESRLSIYRRIRKDFIGPWTGEGGDPNFSMLLYGPPGTGKTTVASGLAAALKRRFITITVSDFLAEGGAQLEARAKDIFTVLMVQPDCVVLFDEIDHFLLDRDSERYGKQDTVFQFMTPGMLTKLNDLRRRQRCLFVVATNYEDRIDAAIKRTGRIDRKYLVLPPDADKRKYFIQQWIGEAPMNPATNKYEKPLFGEVRVTADQWVTLKRESLFLGFSDIEGAVKDVRDSQPPTFELLAKALKDRARTTSLEAYQSRFNREGSPLPVRETPTQEFLCLLALYCEAHLGRALPPGKPEANETFDLPKDAMSESAIDVVGKCYRVVAVEIEGKEGAAGVVARYAPELNDRATQAVAGVLLRCKPPQEQPQPRPQQ
ncbi:ATP-binding protein [Burkholderia gladioli]|uniref:ATPase central domain-containing protein n=1 Tax=Burkholderia gladioli (strain BSR3) TaxID=999541 RepID=F2LRZ9_BURGS|nr:ATP-binding protein [Burkholderia gladioli]AEA65454.1 ATPase central domain-containing protein [Burkholderia gladioli BSR3]MBW5288167.1 AAA family ATPase [Burkholderia gladioli]